MVGSVCKSFVNRKIKNLVAGEIPFGIVTLKTQMLIIKTEICLSIVSTVGELTNISEMRLRVLSH
jgi:hypothetical protein